jgi:hypothetical protein
MKKIDKNRLHTVYFKIKNENGTEDHNILRTFNFISFFANFDISIETYKIKFLINTEDEYFIKFEIKYQSLQSILENLNTLCIFNDCHEKIIGIDEIFCQSHLSSEMIKTTDIQTINSYFSIRNQKLETSFFEYTKQSDLFNYLKIHPRNNNNDIFIVENFELILVSKPDNLLEIKLNFDDDGNESDLSDLSNLSDLSDSVDIDFKVSINGIEELSLNDSDDSDDSDDNDDNLKQLKKCFTKIMNIRIPSDDDLSESESDDDLSESESDDDLSESDSDDDLSNICESNDAHIID